MCEAVSVSGDPPSRIRRGRFFAALAPTCCIAIVPNIGLFGTTGKPVGFPACVLYRISVPILSGANTMNRARSDAI